MERRSFEKENNRLKRTEEKGGTQMGVRERNEIFQGKEE